MQRDKFKCKKCGDSETTLHVHHLSYEQNKMAWEYEKSNFITLCEDCHVFIEQKIKDKTILRDDVRDLKILRVTGFTDNRFRILFSIIDHNLLIMDFEDTINHVVHLGYDNSIQLKKLLRCLV